MMMEMIKGDLAALNIRHDVFFSERSLNENGNDRVGATIAELRAKGDVYEGRLPPPKGAPVGIMRIANRPCSAPRRSAMTSIVR